jgi:2-iminobutanoate/2-iminopropanoate deaminase
MDEPKMGHAEVLSGPPAREVIATENAPAAVGPYSQGIRAGDFVFTAGQLGMDPSTGKLEAVLEAAGSSLARVVKVTVFMQDMNDFQAVNGVYAQFFTQDPPARSAVQVAALPLGGLVEIEAIALC